MDNKEVFYKVKAHLIQAKGRSAEGSSCKYRGPDGGMCAVGCLIPDELYDPTMEGLNYVGIPEKFPMIKDFFDGVSVDLISELQSIHDETSSWSMSDGKFVAQHKLNIVERQLLEGYFDEKISAAPNGMEDK